MIIRIISNNQLFVVFFSDCTILTVSPSNVVTVNQRVILHCQSDYGSDNTVSFHIFLSNSAPICTLVLMHFFGNCIAAENYCKDVYNNFCKSYIHEQKKIYSFDVIVPMHWKGAFVFCQDDYVQSNIIFFIVKGAVIIKCLYEIFILHFCRSITKVCLYCCIIYKLISFSIQN